VEDKEQAARLLADVLNLKLDVVSRKLNSQRSFVWIERIVTSDQAATLDAMTLPKGIGRVSEPARQYPYGRLAAAVIGFANIDTDGLEGLELQYNEVLAGNPGRMIGQKDARQRVFFPDGVNVEGFEPGGSIRLTLDASIQWYAEDALDRVVERMKPAGCWAIVVDVETGEVLAMANRPTFNPGAPGSYPAAHRRNRAVTDQFEPGSMVKPLTMAMALEEGKVDLGERIYCENGRMVIYDRPIRDTKPHGWLTPSEIIQVSSNIGAAKIGMRLGRERMYHWLTRFGFGKRCGLDMPGEASGALRSYKKWYPVDICTHAYGHGLSVSALQMLMSTAALGNGGRLMRPYLVAETLDAEGRVIERNNPLIVRRVVSETVADQVLAMMRLVATADGTARLAAVDGFIVAGKTGTAYKVDPRTKTYNTKKLVSSFVGLVPGRNPRLGIIVVVDEPAGAAYGGFAAGPAFKEIAERSLRYLRIFPEAEPTLPEAPQQRNRPLLAQAEKKKRIEVDKREIAEGRTPDFIGLTMRKAMQLAGRSGVELSIVGSGVAIKQKPAPGRNLPANKQVMVEFVPPS